MSKFDLLTRHIPELQKGDYGDWYMGYPDAVNALHRDLYDFCDTHPEYDYANYRETLEQNGLEWGIDSMSDANVSELDAKVIVALFIGAYRAERFCDGVIMDFLKNGSFLRWLQRLQELDESNGE